MGVVNVDSGNWSSGAGVVDSYNSLVTDIKNAHDEDKGVVAVEIGVTAVSAVIDTVAFALNPLSKLIAAGLGWLIEHVEFLRKPLDWLAGNPDGIKALADDLHKIGQDLRNTATDMDNAMRSTLDSWTGQTADNYKKNLGDRRSDVDGAGHSVDIAGYVVETTMALISAVRALIRDMITSTLGDIISTMLIALATAPVTFGSSIAVGIGKCVVEGTISVAEMTAKIAKLLPFVARVAKRLDDLVEVLKKTASNLGNKYDGLRGIKPPADTTPTPHTTTSSNDEPEPTPHEDDPNTGGDNASTHTNDSTHSDDTTHTGDSVYQDWLNADKHFNGDDSGTPSSSVHDDTTPHDATTTTSSSDEPEPTPHADDETGDHQNGSHENTGNENTGNENTDGDRPADDGGTRPADAGGAVKTPESLLKPFEHPNLKQHEDWLKKIGFKDELATTKFNENWLKEHNPTLFTALKTISDAKSSKNMMGLTDKYVTQLVKQLADIQQRAQMSWDQANTQWQQEHPDSTA